MNAQNNKFTCENHRPVSGVESMHEAAEIFAARKARALFGRSGYARTCNLESYSQDGTLGEYNAFVGYSTGRNETTGRNVRFTVICRDL
jgi:hypothetical protein